MESGSLFERIGGRPGLLRLLWHFYADVRQHKLLGPIFERQIRDWSEHIEKIADFWSRVTGGPADYGGGMPGPHIPLRLSEEHFQAWLGLFEVNCRNWLAPDCAEDLSAVAQQIGKRLRQFCGVPQPSESVFNPSKFPTKNLLKP